MTRKSLLHAFSARLGHTPMCKMRTATAYRTSRVLRGRASLCLAMRQRITNVKCAQTTRTLPFSLKSRAKSIAFVSLGTKSRLLAQHLGMLSAQSAAKAKRILTSKMVNAKHADSSVTQVKVLFLLAQKRKTCNA